LIVKSTSAGTTFVRNIGKQTNRSAKHHAHLAIILIIIPVLHHQQEGFAHGASEQCQ
jgi:hypothetical protein